MGENAQKQPKKQQKTTEETANVEMLNAGVQVIIEKRSRTHYRKQGKSIRQNDEKCAECGPKEIE